ncbi:MAG: hypothetical protein WC717_05080 [Candidatus Micrarchaeia archaeon]
MFSRRGQVFAIDFVVATIVFVLCLAFINSFWQNSLITASKAVDRNRLVSSAIVATDALLASPGAPGNWEINSSNATSLGLARIGSPGEIDFAKLSNLTAMPAENVSRLLGFRQQYYLMVEGLGRDDFYQSGNASLAGSRGMGITRYAVLDGKAVRVRLFLYD